MKGSLVKSTILFLLLLLCMPGLADTVVEKTPDGIILHTPQGITKLRVIRDDIIQIIKSPTDQLPQRKAYRKSTI